MNVLITGAFGNVGRSVVNACLEAGCRVTIMETPRAIAKPRLGMRDLLRRSWKACRIVSGDVRSDADVARALAACGGRGADAVIHLAGIIPPLILRDPDFGWDVNVNGTRALVDACARQAIPPRFVLASSIAAYGDRLAHWWINACDPLAPDDLYGRSKVECERILRESGLPFVILRLSYVVWARWLPLDPTLFDVPPATRLEVVHTEDAGRAFASAARVPGIEGRTLDIGGGASCRTTFRAYLDRMFRLFGLGDSRFLPDALFARGDFHCGWYGDSDEAEALLGFRTRTLEDYYDEVRWATRFLRPAAALAAPLARALLIAASPRRAVLRTPSPLPDGFPGESAKKGARFQGSRAAAPRSRRAGRQDRVPATPAREAN